jgi:hypothetical protein
MMLPTGLRSEAATRAELPRERITEGAARSLFPFAGGKFARKFHALASNLSMTRWSRMTAGASSSSK